MLMCTCTRIARDAIRCGHAHASKTRRSSREQLYTHTNTHASKPFSNSKNMCECICGTPCIDVHQVYGMVYGDGLWCCCCCWCFVAAAAAAGTGFSWWCCCLSVRNICL